MPTRALAVIACADAKKFYVLRRKSTGRWELPGGRIDSGESVKTAAKRETLEELGVHPQSGHKVAVNKIKRGGRLITLKIYFFARHAGIPHVAEPRVFDDVRLVSLEEASLLPLAKSLRKSLNALHSCMS